VIWIFVLGLVEPHDCGPLDRQCVFCAALHFKLERFCCCANGKVYLKDPPQCPPFLRWLLTSTNRHAMKFRKHINNYNTRFSFASRQIHQIFEAGGIQVGKQRGPTRHTTSAVLPPVDGDGKEGKPMFGRIFHYDPVTAAKLRLDQHDNTDGIDPWVISQYDMRRSFRFWND